MPGQSSGLHTIEELDVPSDLNLLMPDSDRAMPRRWSGCCGARGPVEGLLRALEGKLLCCIVLGNRYC